MVEKPKDIVINKKNNDERKNISTVIIKYM